MVNEEATLKDYSDDRKELRESILDLIVKFEKTYPGAEVNSVRINRLDVTDRAQASRGERSSVIGELELSIIVE